MFEWDTFMCWFHGCYHELDPFYATCNSTNQRVQYALYVGNMIGFQSRFLSRSCMLYGSCIGHMLLFGGCRYHQFLMCSARQLNVWFLELNTQTGDGPVFNSRFWQSYSVFLSKPKGLSPALDFCFSSIGHRLTSFTCTRVQQPV